MCYAFFFPWKTYVAFLCMSANYIRAFYPFFRVSSHITRISIAWFVCTSWFVHHLVCYQFLTRYLWLRAGCVNVATTAHSHWQTDAAINNWWTCEPPWIDHLPFSCFFVVIVGTTSEETEFPPPIVINIYCLFLLLEHHTSVDASLEIIDVG